MIYLSMNVYVVPSCQSIYISIFFDAKEMCYSELLLCWCCCLVVCRVMVLAVCVFVHVIVDCAFEPVKGIVLH